MDFIFQRLPKGGWVVVKLKDGSSSIAGMYGKESWVSQSPSKDGHDLWLQEIWTVGADGKPATNRPR